jgi:hypothetical protein
MSDFAALERLTDQRREIDAVWRSEVLRLSKVYSTRLVAARAGVSHNAVWKIAKKAGK